MAVNVKIVKLDPGVTTPFYTTKGSVAVDLSAWIDVLGVRINPGERVLISTGLKMAIPAGFEGQIRPRSGLAYKNGITVVNTPGTLDSDYTGEIKVCLINLGQRSYTVMKGDRIAQLVVAEVPRVEFTVVDSLDETARGSGGFGSTGV